MAGPSALAAEQEAPDGARAQRSLHADLGADGLLDALVRSLRDGRPPADASILGEPGLGKSHCLRMLGERAQAAGAVVAWHEPALHRAETLLPSLASAVLEAIPPSRRGSTLAAPRWCRDLAAFPQRARTTLDPSAVGRSLARALDANAPMALLIDGIDRLPAGRTTTAYLHCVQTMMGLRGPGTLVVWTGAPESLHSLLLRAPRLRGDRHWRLRLSPLDEARSRRLLEAWLAPSRVADGVDPLHPFRPDALPGLHRASHGNPRRLLQLAETLWTCAAEEGPFELGESDVARMLARSGTA